MHIGDHILRQKRQRLHVAVQRLHVAVQVVDTTGAGDCFTGALAVALLEGMPYQQAMQFAGMLPSKAQPVLYNTLRLLPVNIFQFMHDMRRTNDCLTCVDTSNKLNRQCFQQHAGESCSMSHFGVANECAIL